MVWLAKYHKKKNYKYKLSTQKKPLLFTLSCFYAQLEKSMSPILFYVLSLSSSSSIFNCSRAACRGQETRRFSGKKCWCPSTALVASMGVQVPCILEDRTNWHHAVNYIHTDYVCCIQNLMLCHCQIPCLYLKVDYDGLPFVLPQSTLV